MSYIDKNRLYQLNEDGIIDTVKEKANNITTGIGNGISNITSGIKNGINGGINKVSNFASGIKKKFTNESGIMVDHLWSPINEGDDCCPISSGISLGKPFSNANNLMSIPINQFGDSMNRFIGDGDSPANNNKNIPALLAARTAGGSPDPKVTNNGINKLVGSGKFKLLRSERDDLGPNG